MNEPQRGRLLIAGPGLGDANFDRTIVYLLEHGPEGSLGVVINRPSQFEVVDALPRLGRRRRPAPGGVQRRPGGGRRGPGPGPGPSGDASGIGWSETVDGDIGSVDLSQGPEAVTGPHRGGPGVRGLLGLGRAASSTTSWAAGAWFVVDAEPDDLFTPEPENLWGAVLRREQARSAMAGSNPSWN